MIYACCDERRRTAVDAHPVLNGIDYLEVLDGDAPAGSPPQQTLLVRCMKPVPALGPEQVRIEGGERVRDIAVLWVSTAAAPGPLATAAERTYLMALPEADHVLVVRTDRRGDFSRYRLRLVRAAADDDPPDDFDPLLADVEFSFKVECPTDFDCLPRRECPPLEVRDPDISYLAKDYGSFRRLILDRIAQLVPGWRERSIADQAVAMAELVAYVGDHLSYQQDAVATEAYLETARRRISLRRHALLVDYRMHNGCNARAWVRLTVRGENIPLSATGTRFYTRVPDLPGRIVPGSLEDVRAMLFTDAVFEPMEDATLHESHDTLLFYTWGDRRCCLPAGATHATLADHLPALAPGNLLLFEEQVGPETGNPADADPAHRHVVRLTRVVSTANGVPRTDPLTGDEITEIAWAEADALPFPLCISAVVLDDAGDRPVENVSVARGNIVLADHGRTVGESLPLVPKARLAWAVPPSGDQCEERRPQLVTPRYLPTLSEAPLTHRAPYDAAAPASAAMTWKLADVSPSISLVEHDVPPIDWAVRHDVLSSNATARDFVVEVEHDGSATLRFGDDRNGHRPNAGAEFFARYRVGNGRSGNVGADTIAHVASTDARIVSVTNPRPASGGTDVETAAEVRRHAPQAFRTQARAVTPSDYEDVTERFKGVQRTAATLRWTGSWHTVFLTVDRTGGIPVDADFENDLRTHVEPFRLTGHDLEVDTPIYVSLELTLDVCVCADYFRSDVRAGLREALGARRLRDGRLGLFHQDRMTFGQTIHVSAILAAARSVPGVCSATVTTLQRQGHDDSQYVTAGALTLGRLEIGRLDDDPNFPERGALRLTLHGGK
jgi:hypothetical protein